MSEPRETRYKIVYVGFGVLEQILNEFRGGNMLRVPIFAELPEGYTVVAIRESFEQQAWMIKVWHESFEIVPDCCKIPVLEVEPKAILFKTLEGVVPA